MTDRLRDKVALVTGAGSVGPGWGNGRSISVLFAQEGARIFAVDRDAAQMDETLARIAEAGGEAYPYEADITDPAGVAAVVNACMSHFGEINVLVNNVGGSFPGGAATLTHQDWDNQLRDNLTSVYLMCHQVLPIMIEQHGGAIVNIEASASGLRYSGAPQVGYAAAKAGVLQLSRVTAVEYAPHGIRVNTVVPGQLHTPMVEARLATQRAGGDVEELLRQRQSRIPLGFAGDGRDTAYAALYLASDEARFVTGAEIVVDGGMTVRCD